MPCFDRVARPLALLVAIGVGLGQSACGVLLQTALGWSEEKVERVRQPHVVRVQTDPLGGRVRRGSLGGPVELGSSPVDDTASFVREKVWTEPKNLGLYVGGGLTTASGIALIAVGANKDGRMEREGASAFGLVFLGTIMLLGGLSELTAGALYDVFGTGRRTERVVPHAYAYRGHSGERPVVVPGFVVPRETALELSWEGLAPPVEGATGLSVSSSIIPGSYLGDRTEPVVAIMDAEDVSAHAPSIALDVELVRNLSDQLRMVIAQRAVHTVGRGAQERALRAHARDSTRGGSDGCYDDACQLELGRALAATHILRSRITRFGSRCVLNAELIDLKSQVTVRAASARGGCEEEDFLTMSEVLSRSLLP